MPPSGVRTPRPDPEPKPQNREQGVLNLLSLPAFAVGLAAGQAPEGKVRTALMADSATITFYAPAIAAGAAETAANDPRFAAVLDRAIALGPYSALLMPVGAMFLQIAANHERLPQGIAGTVSAEQAIAGKFIPEVVEIATDAQEPNSNGRAPSNISA